jgi:F-type H+-transporting ATPase subunit delta
MPHAVATRFAQALADAVLAPGSGTEGRQAASELRAFEAIADSSSELRHVLLSPAVATSRKRALVNRFAAAIPLSRLVRNFLFVVVDRRRADLLGEIATAFETVLDERLGFVRAEVTSAAPLSPAQQSDLQQALSGVAGKNVRCAFSVNPELIGGIVARIGSKVYDGSVRTQLQSLGERLVSQ